MDVARRGISCYVFGLARRIALRAASLGLQTSADLCSILDVYRKSKATALDGTKYKDW